MLRLLISRTGVECDSDEGKISRLNSQISYLTETWKNLK